MSEAALTLGPIVFRDFEIPSAISFGGRQRIAVRYLTTGRRVVDVLGPDDATISFSGVLSGPNASGRAREIDGLRTLGRPLNLFWNNFLYSVIIRSFDADFENQWWINYQVRCIVLENPNVSKVVTALSGVTAALDSLNLMYGIVPPTLLPVPDLRPMLTPNVQHGSSANSSSVIAELRRSGAMLATAQQRQEHVFGLVPIDGALPTPQYLRAFGSMIDAASALQYLTLSQHCLGQAAVCLAQEVNS